jgi:hypothetical protein
MFHVIDIMAKKAGCPIGKVKVKGKCVSPKFIKEGDTLFTKVKPLGVFVSPKIWKDTIGSGKLIMLKSEEKDSHHISRGYLFTVSKSGWHREKYQVGRQGATGYDEKQIMTMSERALGESIYPERYSIHISNVRDTVFDQITKQQADRLVKNIAKSF